MARQTPPHNSHLQWRSRPRGCSRSHRSWQSLIEALALHSFRDPAMALVFRRYNDNLPKLNAHCLTELSQVFGKFYLLKYKYFFLYSFLINSVLKPLGGAEQG